MFDNHFEIKIDASKCTSLVEGGAFLDGKKVYDSWRFKDIKLESGKIYGLVGEYGQGSMYLSYLVGGKVDFGDLRLFCNGQELSRSMLEQTSWNLEPSNEKYRNAVVKKSIEKALLKNQCTEDFNAIAKKFIQIPSMILENFGNYMQKSLMEKSGLSSMIEKINSISSKEDFIEFLQNLATDYTDNNDVWENKTISDYLEQISSWIEDYAASPANDIAWENVDFQILARMLYMGKIYE